MSRLHRTLAAAILLAGATPVPSWSQVRDSCPPGLKWVAGACVRSCPGGYEDQGDRCVYRNMSR
ncbi:hypothetical protein [Methylobacterium oryzisoli]|uniref:hypothetical protein n=1 Tax=Methylobacterium oryzisoli TaxID=3385502 RepID=UPI003892B200